MFADMALALTFAIQEGADCATPINLSLLTIPVSGSTLLEIVSTDLTCVANGLGYFRCKTLRVCIGE
jgi:hypothetical protein